MFVFVRTRTSGFENYPELQSRLKVSIRVAQKYAFLLCIGGWCKPMVEVELLPSAASNPYVRWAATKKLILLPD
jgi:hypothetical protein